MSNRWFRVYSSIRHDPKVQRLPYKARWVLLMLWTLASENDGIIPEDNLAFELRMRPSEVKELINLYVGFALLEREGDKLVPHNWRGRQYKNKEAENRIAGNAGDSTASERMKRMRQKHDTVYDTEKNVSQITDTDTETETEKKQTRARGALDVGFKSFWVSYPHKVGKAAALKAYLAARKRGASSEEIVAGVARYRRFKPPDRPWCNPATFLNQDRWLDEPARGPETVQETAARLVREREEKNGIALEWLESLDAGRGLEIRANSSECIPTLPAPRGSRGLREDAG